MIYEEPELLDDLRAIILNQLAIVINPAFTTLFQCKALMKYIYESNPGHPNLLRTEFSPKHSLINAM